MILSFGLYALFGRRQIDLAISTGMDVHNFALSTLKILSKEYTMKFLLLGPLAAFAVTHGIWLLVLKFICTDLGDESILMVLKRVEELFNALRQNLRNEEIQKDHDLYMYVWLLSSSVTRKPRDNWKSMSSVYNLVRIMFEVGSLAHFILKDIYDSIPKLLKDEFDSLILLSIYWITSGVLTCSAQCDKLPKNEYVIQDSQKLTYIHDKLISIHEKLLKLESSGKQYMDEELIVKCYQLPCTWGNYYTFKALFQSDNFKIFRCNKMDMDLSDKDSIFLLLISDLDISSNEIDFLNDIYVESKASVQQDFELIWIPIHNGPWTTFLEGQYKKLLQMMSWYTTGLQSSISEETRLFIKNIWKFHRKPIIVVLDEDTHVVCPNAIHLMHIWGSKAFPFTRQRERTLWSTEARLNSLVLGFDSEISSMVKFLLGISPPC